MGASWADQKFKKLSFWRVVFSYSMQQWIISRSNCDVQRKMDFIWQPAQCLNWEAPKHFPKPKLNSTTKKGHGHRWSAADLIHGSFLGASQVVLVVKNPPANEGDIKRHWFDPWVGTIPSEPQQKPLHLRSMLSKPMRCTENCNTRSPHWSTKRAQFSMTMPNYTSHNKCFKRWMNWTTTFCLIHHIHLLLLLLSCFSHVQLCATP